MDDQGCSSSVPSLLELFSISSRTSLELRWLDDDYTHWSWSDSEVQRLLVEGANINEQGVEGYTALHMATIENKWETVQLLLDRGASFDVKDNEGRTAFFYAGLAEDTEFVRQMLLKGADINEQDQHGNTVLHYAVKIDSEQLVELLLNSGADVNCQNNDGRTPIYNTHQDISSKIVTMLLDSGAIVNCEDSIGTTPLHGAAYNRNYEIAEMLLKLGVNVNCRNSFGETPLNNAVCKGSYKVVEMLLEAGAMVNCKHYKGRTELHYATLYPGSPPERMLDALLQAGALLEVKDDDGRTPVSYTGHANEKAIEYLILKGARIDEKDNASIPLTPWERCLISKYSHAELLVKLSSANLLKGNNKINLMDEDIKMKIGHRLERVMNYEIKCMTEVNKMKAHKIGTLTLFSVFSDSPDPGFASRADEIQEVLDEAEQQHEYPIYLSLLKSKLKEGVCRRALLDDACDILSRLIPILNSPEVKRMILVRLSNKDLKNIITAFI